jgi:hypothetical protein
MGQPTCDRLCVPSRAWNSAERRGTRGEWGRILSTPPPPRPAPRPTADWRRHGEDHGTTEDTSLSVWLKLTNVFTDLSLVVKNHYIMKGKGCVFMWVWGVRVSVCAGWLAASNCRHQQETPAPCLLAAPPRASDRPSTPLRLRSGPPPLLLDHWPYPSMHSVAMERMNSSTGTVHCTVDRQRFPCFKISVSLL